MTGSRQATSSGFAPCLVLAFALGCIPTTEIEVESPADPPVTAPSESALEDAEEAGETEGPPAPEPETRAWIRLHRTACYGTCPVYAVTLFDDGEVTWEGIDFVNRLGPASAAVSPKTVTRLIERFERFNLDGVPEEHPGYGKCATDSPSSVIESSSSHGTRRAVHYYGCRGAKLAALGLLERKIDRVADSDRWISDTACASMVTTSIYYLDEDTSVDDGHEPVHEVRRERLDAITHDLKTHPDIVVRLRAVMDGRGLAPVRMAKYAAAIEDRGVEAARVLSYVHDPTAMDPMGWNYGKVSIDLGPRECFETE